MTMHIRALLAALSMALMLDASSGHAQQDDTDSGSPRGYGGAQVQYARPVGEFQSYVKHGGGINVYLLWPVTEGNPFALRADGGFIIYGSETRRVCFSQTVGCRILLDLRTTNNIAYFNIGGQLMMPHGKVRPYANAAIGGSYFSTSSGVSGTDGNDEDFASTTNFSDLTFAWAGGGGLLIQLSSGRTPLLLDLGVRYHGNGEVEYLKKGDIIDNPDGTIRLTPTRSQANLLTFQIGMTAGASSRRR